MYPNFERWHPVIGMVVIAPHGPLSGVHFPASLQCSMSHDTADTIGWEGMDLASARLLHSRSLVAGGLSVDVRNGTNLAGITLFV